MILRSLLPSARTAHRRLFEFSDSSKDSSILLVIMIYSDNNPIVFIMITIRSYLLATNFLFSLLILASVVPLLPPMLLK